MSNESRLHSLLMDHYINIDDQATHFNKGIFLNQIAYTCFRLYTVLILSTNHLYIYIFFNNCVKCAA